MSDVESLIRDSAALLMDFDGPVCKLFAGYPASEIADQLRRSLSITGPDVPPGPNPLKVLLWVSEHRPELLDRAEELLIAGELAAVGSASPTPHAASVFVAAQSRGIPMAVASNNAPEAVLRYLSLHGLTPYVIDVSGRTRGHPERMKPDPDSLLRAASALGIPATACLLVGDAPSDMEAARKAGSRRIGYAKTTDRASALVEAGAQSIVHGMDALEAALVKAGA